MHINGKGKKKKALYKWLSENFPRDFNEGR